MAGLLELEEEKRRNLALANPRSIAGLLGAVGENPNARMMSMAQDYARNLPQQLATNQQAMQSAIGGWNKTDFATGQQNPNYYPEAINELTQLMPNFAGTVGKSLLAEYRGSHVAPNAKEYGGTLDNLGAIMPEDVYSSKGQRLYGIGDRQIDSEWFSAAYKAKGNPDRLVEVYRAVPKGVTDINQGDWVTTSKTYAKNHGENALNDEYEIISKKVKASTLSSEGYPYEFGYNE